jgi:hypothetical protein
VGPHLRQWGYVSAYGFALANSTLDQPLVGASGAVAGVLGAYLVLFPRARVWGLLPVLLFIPLRLPAWLVLGVWFVLQWVYSSGYGVAGAGSVAYLARTGLHRQHGRGGAAAPTPSDVPVRAGPTGKAAATRVVRTSRARPAYRRSVWTCSNARRCWSS